MGIEYLIDDVFEVRTKRGKDIQSETNRITELVEKGEFEEVQKIEDELLREFNVLKLRIDMISTEDKVDNVKLYEERLNLSAINVLLHAIIALNPHSELGKTYKK